MQTVMGTNDDMEEERRLAYVALTRAKEQIYIMYTKHRLLYGQTQANPLSRFVTEIPEQYTLREEKDFSSGSYSNGYGAKIYYSERTAPQQPAKAAPSTPYRNAPPRRPLEEQTTIGKPIFEKKPLNKRIIFNPGDRVKHQTFGEGEILSARNMGADVLYEVMFDRVGTKRLMATYAKLQKI
jgi:DNA helicase-2/ATP-dependent DNA helicase PcrA